MDSEAPGELLQLQRRLRRISARQQDLERRLQRIENSAVFRLLRWIGPRLAALGLPVPGVLPDPGASPAGEADAYQRWIAETEDRHVEPYPCLDPGAPPVSVLIDSAGAEPVHLERSLASLRNQTHPPNEVLVQSASSGDLPNADAEKRPSGAILRTAAHIFEPDALAAFAAQLAGGAAVVYSDWDHIDPQGRRHSPRFTPEFSPELLRSTPYFGGCYLTAPGFVREMPWPEPSVRRVPRILWHAQQPVSVTLQPPLPHPVSAARASIIICTRNPQRLARCLSGLRPTLDPRHEIVVVAHNVAHNMDVPPRGATIVPYRGPFHFGRMNAQGVEKSTGDVLCFLNDDVFPTSPGWLESMLAQAARPGVGVVGALLLYPDGTIQHAGVVVDRWHPAHVGRFQKNSAYWPWLRMTREVSAVTGACMVIGRSTWNDLGGFDPQFPVNYNDIDLCLRAAARGYRVILESRAVLVHEEARTRVALVQPEEAERFHERWSEVTDRPDAYFNPQLSVEDETIRLPGPWAALR